MHAAEADPAEEVLDVVLPANHQPTKMMEPSEQSFHSPTSAITAQRTAVLGCRPALSAMRCDHFNAIALSQIAIQAVAVISFVADQSRREGIEEAVPEDPFDELAFVRRSAFATSSARAMIFVPLPRLVGPTARPPFCPREGGVDESLLRIELSSRL